MSDAQRARIRRRIRAIPVRMAAAAHASLQLSAAELVQLMKTGAPHKSGDLVDSIRDVDESVGGRPARFRVAAGGARTMKPVRRSKKGHGVMYDYAKAVEYGTNDDPAQPFFWPSYRRLKRKIRARLMRALKKAAQGGG